MGFRFNFKWLLLSLALSVLLTVAVRALTGIWFLGFFLFLPFGMSFGSRSFGNPGPTSTEPAPGAFDPTPYTQDELRQPPGSTDIGGTS